MNRRQQLARPGNLAALAKINPNKRLFFFTNFFVFDFFSIIGSLFFHLVSFLLFFFFLVCSVHEKTRLDDLLAPFLEGKEICERTSRRTTTRKRRRRKRKDQGEEGKESEVQQGGGVEQKEEKEESLEEDSEGEEEEEDPFKVYKAVGFGGVRVLLKDASGPSHKEFKR